VNEIVHVLNGVGSDFLEGISFQDLHVSMKVVAQAEENLWLRSEFKLVSIRNWDTARVCIYARNVRSLTLNNVRLEVD